jgi:hypothetical protein
VAVRALGTSSRRSSLVSRHATHGQGRRRQPRTAVVPQALQLSLRSMKYAVLVVALIVLAAGCASGTTPTSQTPSSSATASVDASPTVKPQLSNQLLGSLYLTAAQPFNEYTCRFLRAHGTSTDMTVWMPFARMYAGHLLAFADRLHSIDWNRKTRGEARRMTDALAVAEAAYREAAAKLYPRPFWKALDRTDSLDASVTQAANELRAALGLKAVRPCI